MPYSVKELFFTLQGEGANTGRAAVFCRFAGCNLWSGRESDRGDAVCNFCDTDFVGTNGVGGGKFQSAGDLARRILAEWPSDVVGRPFVVCTGGEPLLQLDSPLIDELHQLGFEVAVETNGTVDAPPGIDWLCVSPKGKSELRLRSGHELKLVYPQEGINPAAYEEMSFEHFFLQPMDGLARQKNTKETIDYCMKHPRWRLSLQTHKVLGIP